MITFNVLERLSNNKKARYLNLNLSYYLGEGSYSSVFLVKRVSDGETYALKKVKMEELSEKEKTNAINEIRILASIKHPNIVSYKEAFIEEATSTLWYF